jgi:hypothetical protein
MPVPIFQQNLNSSSMLITCKEELPGKQLLIPFWTRLFVSIVFFIIFPFLLSFPSDISQILAYLISKVEFFASSPWITDSSSQRNIDDSLCL